MDIAEASIHIQKGYRGIQREPALDAKCDMP